MLKKKINTSILAALLFFTSALFLNVSALENGTELPLSEIFKNIQAKNLSIFKQKATVEISSALVKTQLNNIPREMKELGKEPILFLQHVYGTLPRLELSHVESFYANFFAPYEDILQRSGLFLGVDTYTTLNKFLSNFVVEKITKNDDGISIHVREKKGLKGDYAIFFFSNEWLLKRAKFFEAQSLSAEMSFFYKKRKNSLTPLRLKMEMLNPNDPTHFIINFFNFKSK